MITDQDYSQLDGGQYTLCGDCDVVIGESATLIGDQLDAVICSMKQGETAYVKSKMDINCEKVADVDLKTKGLKFHVTLNSFTRNADWDELEKDERLEMVQNYKNKGTDLFKQLKLDFAINRFEKAVELLNDFGSVEELPVSLLDQHNLLNLQCHLNLGACYLKKEDFEKVVSYCSKAIDVDDTNVKGLFRRGQAYVKLNQYDEAKVDLHAALKLEPENKAVAVLLRQVEATVKNEKQMYQKMFS